MSQNCFELQHWPNQDKYPQTSPVTKQTKKPKNKGITKQKKERKKNAFSLNMFVFNLNQDIM